jgi:hypothetical protein
LGALRFAELRNLLQGVTEKFSPPNFENWNGMAFSAERRCARHRKNLFSPPSGMTLITLLEGLCD